MADSKLSLQIAGFSFQGEGDQKWLSEELEKLLKQQFIQKEIKNPPAQELKDETPNDATISLAKYLKEKDATSNQLKKFLATSGWLQKMKGMTRLKTLDVTNALKDASQSKLGNPSDCLAKNVSAGDIERDGKEFYVTEHGLEKLGL